VKVPRLHLPRFDRLPGAFLLLAACALALTQGRYPLTLSDEWEFLLSVAGLRVMDPARHELLRSLIVELRLPRVLCAVLVGASLSASGAAYQAVFRNPLVSPSILGVLAGASAGAAIGIVATTGWFWVQVLAFLGGILAVSLALMISRVFGARSTVLLVLGGIVSGAVFSSLLTMVKYLADPENELPAIVYWLMGNLSQATLGDLAWAAPVMVAGVLGLCVLGRALDAVSMGDDEARSLGVPVGAVRLSVIVLATLVSALTVALGGMIGWIGLVVPHIARLLVGPANARLVPASAWTGAVFLLLADGLARGIFSTELPVGVVTEWLGIPVFVLVLARVRKGWSS
jgi:iron complex transport system permease protein